MLYPLSLGSLFFEGRIIITIIPVTLKILSCVPQSLCRLIQTDRQSRQTQTVPTDTRTTGGLRPAGAALQRRQLASSQV